MGQHKSRSASDFRQSEITFRAAASFHQHSFTNSRAWQAAEKGGRTFSAMQLVPLFFRQAVDVNTNQFASDMPI
jgi:hypothetical protein